MGDKASTPFVKSLKVTPNAFNRHIMRMNALLEQSRYPPEPIDLDEEITFFNNEKAHGTELGYDQYFSFTKTFPLFDKRKKRENKPYPPDVWKGIYQQEHPPKTVPATTSQMYGRRPFYDHSGGFNRKRMLSEIYRRNGVQVVQDDEL